MTKMMRLLNWIVKMILFLTAVWTAVLACNPSTITGVAGAPVSSRTPCISDESCPPTYFCYGNLNAPKFCSRCLDCNRYNRLPKKETTCAKNGADCGNCQLGYIEAHNYCEPDPNHKHKEINSDSGSIDEAWIWGPVVVLVVILITITSCGIVLWKRDRIKGNPSGDATEMVNLPTSRSSQKGEESRGEQSHLAASAPELSDEEYGSPPAYNDLSRYTSRPSTESTPARMNFIRETGPIRTVPLMAGPFDRGNGSGEWHDDAGNVIADDIGFVDGPAHHILNDVGFILGLGPANQLPNDHLEPFPANGEEGVDGGLIEVVNVADVLDVINDEDGIVDDNMVAEEGNLNEIQGMELDNQEINHVPLVGIPGLGQQDFVDLDYPNDYENDYDFFFEVQLDMNLGYYHARNRNRSYRSAFNPEETVMDLPALESSHNSSTLSMSVGDSGTGTGDENSMDASFFGSATSTIVEVPDIDNPANNLSLVPAYGFGHTDDEDDDFEE